MRVRFSLVARTGTPVDLVVDCDRGASGTELTTALVEQGLIDDGDRVYCADRAVDDGLVVGHPPLVDGFSLSTHPILRGSGAGSIVSVVVRGGPDAGRTHRIPWGETTIGRGAGVDLHLDDPHLSRHHATLVLDGTGVSLRPAGTTNPVLVDGAPIGGPTAITDVSVLSLGRTTVAISSSTPWEPALTRPDGEGHVAVHRSPHHADASPARVVEIPDPPAAPRGLGIPWAMLLIPLPISALMAVFLGPTMLVFGLFGPVMALGNVLVERVGRSRDGRRAEADHRHALDTARHEARTLLGAERRSRDLAHPDPATVLETATRRLTPLWARAPDSPDFLHVRCGLGTVPSRHTVRRGGQTRHPDLRITPVAIDLPTAGVVGVAGPQAPLEGAVRAMVGQIAVLHSPNDVRIHTLTGSDTSLEWCDWLPHSGESVADLGQELDRRVAGGAAAPAVVVVAVGCERLRTDPLWRDLLTHGPQHRVFVLAASTQVAALPHECRATLDLTAAPTPHLVTSGAPPIPLVVDGVGPWWVERLARAAAPLRDATPGAARLVPAQCSLRGLLTETATPIDGPADVSARWRDTTGGPLPIGIGEDGPVTLDLTAHGPHALVAGTTGSGKSELLQTWALTMALAYPPSALNLFFADFKGGATFTELAQLPHSVGLVTDLDAGTAQRALASLQQEVRHREEVLAAAGARSLDALDNVGGEVRLPRLVLMIDEFRVLAEEHPDILDGFVRVASVGRSLGIHLVLATQRPAGIVSADVAANTSLRVALRTQDVGDSRYVLGAPDAAHIPATCPGRAVYRGDTDSVSTFQVARVGGTDAPDQHPLRVRPLGSPDPEHASTGPTELTQLIAWAGEAAELVGEVPATPLWHPPLPSVVSTVDLLDLPGGSAESVRWGLVDEPDRRRWAPLVWNRRGGHVALIGSDVSAREEAVLALVEQVVAGLSPDDVHLHLLTALALPSAVRNAEHLGTVLDPSDTWTAKRFLTRVAGEARSRRAHVAGSPPSVGAPAAPSPPTLLLVVDADTVSAGPSTGADDGLRDLLIEIMREGGAADIGVVLSGSRSLLLGRLSSLADERYVLPLADSSDLTLAGVSRGALDGAPRGRAIRARDGAQVQLARPGGVTQAQTRSGPAPLRVRPLPSEVDLSDVPAQARHGRAGWVLGVGGDAAELVSLDPADIGRRLLITGPSGSGRTTVLATLARSASARGMPVALVGPSPSGGDEPSFGAGDAAALRAHLERHPDALVLVDDADRLVGSEVDELLCAHEAGLDAVGGAMVVAVSASALATTFRGLPMRVARAQSGVLLCPASPIDGEPFGLRVDPMPRTPGRGYLISSGRAVGVQVALTAPRRSRRGVAP